MRKNINISIVLFNSEFAQINNLVKTLKANNNLNKIYLVDNSPSISNEFRICDANYIFTGKNIGYGAGHNLAIHKSINDEVKYHLVLNPDIYFEPEALTKLLNYMDQNEHVGLIMPMIKYPNGETQYLCKLLATPLDLFGRRFIPFKHWIDRRNNKYELRFTGYNKTMQIPSLSGCFMLLRIEVLKKVGNFDERFFMYCEDLDLCRRINVASKTIFYPEISVTHKYEKGSYNNFTLLRYHINSAFKYFNKWGWFFDKEKGSELIEKLF